MNERPDSPDTPTPSDSPPPDSAAPAIAEPTNDERNLALLVHLLGFFTSVIGPLIIWLVKKDSSKFIDHHGKQALNFQITVLIAFVIGSFTAFLIIGCVIAIAALVLDIVFCIIAAMAASKGEWYRYPIAIPLLR